MSDIAYWIALRSVSGIGEVLYKNLISVFKHPKLVFNASKNDLLKVEGVGEGLVYQVKDFSDWDQAEKQALRIEKSRYKFKVLTDSDYPTNLINIHNPPPYYHLSGNIIPDDRMSIAVVGSRSPDQYGSAVTQKLVKGLVDTGFTIISGLAKGIDSIAHKAALKNNGRTIAVLGSGLDYIYPYENRNLYNQIVKNGAVISEFELGTKPEAVNFPRRNRLISGLSLGVVVIQATEKSGSLITADFALEQNREVFAVPGNIANNLSKGTHNLIKKGAKLVNDLEDILEEIHNVVALDLNKKNLNVNDKQKPIDGDEQKVLDYIGNDPVHVDNIINYTNLDTSTVLTVLLTLELNDLVVQLPGKYYQLG